MKYERSSFKYICNFYVDYEAKVTLNTDYRFEHVSYQFILPTFTYHRITYAFIYILAYIQFVFNKLLLKYCFSSTNSVYQKKLRRNFFCYCISKHINHIDRKLRLLWKTITTNYHRNKIKQKWKCSQLLLLCILFWVSFNHYFQTINNIY